MTIEQIKQQLIDEGQNPDYYSILITNNGYSVWKKDFAPNFMKASEQVSELGDKKVKADVDYLAIMSGVDLNV